MFSAFACELADLLDLRNIMIARLLKKLVPPLFGSPVTGRFVHEELRQFNRTVN